MKLIISFLFALTAFAQNSIGSGKITYKFEVFPDRKPIENPKFNLYQKNFDKAIQDLRFELIFNEDLSKFGVIKSLISDNNRSSRYAILASGGNSTFYFERAQQYLVERKEFLGEIFRIRDSTKENKWQLTQETKEISGYTCYKAIGVRYVTNRDFTEKEVPLVAWFCPDIPVGFGPYEAVGLPGIVLELEMNTGYSLVVEKIEFDENLKVEQPKDGTLVTKEKFNSLMKPKTVGRN